MNSMVLDCLIILHFVLLIFWGIRSGVMKSFLMFVSSIFSSIFSIYLSGIASKMVYDNFVARTIRDNVNNAIGSSSNNINFNLNKIFNGMPEFIKNLFSEYGISNDSLKSIINSSNGISDNVSEKVVKLIEPAFLNFFKSIFAIIIFWVLILVMKSIIKIVLKFLKFKSVRSVDGLIGGLFGALRGYIIALVIMCCIRVLVPMIKDVPKLISQETISSSVIFKKIYLQNPIYDMFQKI